MLTFANRGPVHDPDQGGTELAVGGDAVLSGLEQVAVVLFHLQRSNLKVNEAGSPCAECADSVKLSDTRAVQAVNWILGHANNAWNTNPLLLLIRIKLGILGIPWIP